MNFLNKILNFSAERYLKTAGDLFIYEEDYQSALQMVEKTLQIEPQDIRALVLRGDILYCMNKNQEALHTFNKALSINENCVEALISKAGVLDVLGSYREALNCCSRAFEQIKPFQSFLLPSLYDQNVLLLLRLKKYRQAKHLLKRSEAHLSKEDYQYLQSSYNHIVDRLLKGRLTLKKARLHIPSAKLSLI